MCEIETSSAPKMWSQNAILANAEIGSPLPMDGDFHDRFMNWP